MVQDNHFGADILDQRKFVRTAQYDFSLSGQTRE